MNKKIHKNNDKNTGPLSISRAPCCPAVWIKNACCHTACLYPHRSVSRLQWQDRPVANAAQGYRLGLPSTTHLASQCSKKWKMLIFCFYPWPRQFFVPQAIPGVPWSYPEHLETIALLVPKLWANKHTYRHTHEQNYYITLFWKLYPSKVRHGFFPTGKRSWQANQ